MNKEQLQDIFRQPYNAQTWQELLINLFGASEIRQTPSTITSDSNEKVEGFELGRLYTPDRYEIGLFAFEIKQGHNVQLNRVGLRSLVRSYTRYNVDAALVVYYDATHWRLSFICDIKEQKTAPKRYTYVFGNPNESYRTASAMLAKLADGKPSFENIKSAFSVEALSKDFFKGYKEQYGKFCKYIGGEQKWQRDYVKKMMGRLVFLQFLQKKGWMGCGAAQANNLPQWGNGDLQYTQNLVKRYNGNENLLSEILEPLFFDTLNTKREGDIADPKLGDNIKIPYLNGGLFDQDKLDEKQIDFPYAYFAELMDFFSQYNFTIDENDPNDAEVGIDPEMLGHIFENLLEDNKDKGAFYTPKEIVQYMCRQSLIEYLQSKLGKHVEIENFINTHDTGNRLDGKNYIVANAKAIEELLDNVKICDPAIGSGAFPMGILSEIFQAKMALDMTLDRAAVKKNIIQNSIYGVDIEQGAVDIARLRFWLSLVVDESEPQSLPNLDYKIMQGNSLLESFEGVDLSFYQEKGKVTQGAFDFDGASETRDELKKLIKEYFAVTDHARKDELRLQIDDKVKEHIIKSCGNNPDVIAKVDAIESTNRPFFLWHVYFNDVFEQGGFDIVIGNPPYVNIANIKPDSYRNILKAKFKSAKNKSDLYAFFIERGFEIMTNKGIMAYIIPHTWKATDSFQNLREIIFKNHTLTHIVNLEMGVFGAIVKPLIAIFNKEHQTEYDIEILNQKFKLEALIKSNEITGNNTFSLDTTSNADEKTLYVKIENDSVELYTIIEFSRGIKTSDDKRFILNEDRDKDCKKVFRGKNIKAYSLNWNNEYVWYRPDLMRQKVGCVPYTKDFFETPEKLITQRVNSSSQLLVAYDDSQNYFLDTTNVSKYSTWDKKVSLKYLCGLLNSKLINFWYCNKYKMPTIGIYELHSIPIKVSKNQQPLIKIVDKILEAKKANPTADTTALESQIDQMVYALYNLTPEEIALIEK